MIIYLGHGNQNKSKFVYFFLLRVDGFSGEPLHGLPNAERRQSPQVFQAGWRERRFTLELILTEAIINPC